MQTKCHKKMLIFIFLRKKADFRPFFLLFTANVRSRPPGPPAVFWSFPFSIFWLSSIFHAGWIKVNKAKGVSLKKNKKIVPNVATPYILQSLPYFLTAQSFTLFNYFYLLSGAVCCSIHPQHAQPFLTSAPEVGIEEGSPD